MGNGEDDANRIGELEDANTVLFNALEQIALTAEQDNTELDFNDILVIANKAMREAKEAEDGTG